MSCTIDTHGTRCQCGAADPPPVQAPAATVPAETIRCACGKRASVHVTYLPRPLPLFGTTEIVPVCPSHYRETLTRGRVLGQAAIVETKEHE